MNEEDREKLRQYIELCKRMYERMKKEGFPWEEKIEKDEDSNK